MNDRKEISEKDIKVGEIYYDQEDKNGSKLELVEKTDEKVAFKPLELSFVGSVYTVEDGLIGFRRSNDEIWYLPNEEEK